MEEALQKEIIIHYLPLLLSVAIWQNLDISMKRDECVIKCQVGLYNTPQNWFTMCYKICQQFVKIY